MKLAVLSLVLVVASAAAQSPDTVRLAAQAARITITRDDWGIAHIHGHTDADAVFGMIYAQCEDDFNRVETNYLTSLGRTAEAEGEQAIWQDLRQRLFLDPEDLKRDYAASPPWLRALMDAWADGLNFYLLKHPETHPKVITHFEPWMTLSFTEGSIGGDIERIDLHKLQAFYDHSGPSRHSARLLPSRNPFGLSSSSEAEGSAVAHATAIQDPNPLSDSEPRGSNGFAIAPANTRDHHALLLINPHTSFFFRSELQMSSDEGLNAYGAVTWGQFFIYQGFNERAGWMHTSSNVDAVDEYKETMTPGSSPTYKYGSETRKFLPRQVTLTYKTAAGRAERTFTTYSSSHGPVIYATNGKWVTVQLMNIPISALQQSYLRTKSHTYADYLKTMELKANSSNNTIFADADGDIAYWHGNFIPKRDTRFDYTQPVDGANPATDWHGLMTLEDAPHLKNPASGFLFNVNDSPWNGAGISSLKKADFPAYVEQGIESARGHHAMRVLADKKDFTVDTLLAAAFDSYLPWFGRTIPELVDAYNEAPDPTLAEQIALLKGWNQRWSADSIPTALAVYWGTEVLRTAAAPARAAGIPSEDYIASSIPKPALLVALKAASAKLTADFGTWRTPWGEINRFQRLTSDIAQPFNDAGASIPVPFTSSLFGSLASFGARPYPGTKKWYGTSGNSFVAVIEFGPRVRARAITAGGESGHTDSKHFDDEATRYAAGNLREVYFYPDQLKPHTERTYHPGE
jgi:acyl-homoserine-lactone acylase